MSTFQNIMRMFSFYRRKTVFFAVIFLAVGGFFYVKGQMPVTADSPIATGVGSNTDVSINLNILDSGEVTSNNQKIASVTPVDGFDELRVVLINQPKQYINQFTATVNLPKNVAASSDAKFLAIHGVDNYNVVIIDDSTVEYSATGIGTQAELTAVLKMPSGTINYPLVVQAKNGLSGLSFGFWLILSIALPLFALLFLFYIIFKELRGKVEAPTSQVSSPPMALPPAVVGVIMKQKIGPREVAATLIDLAIRGDIVIVDKERGFVFGKNKLEHSLIGYEKILLSKIFKKTLAASQNEIEERVNKYLYSRKVSAFYYLIQALAQRLGYLKPNYRKIKARYSLAAVIFFLVGIAGFLLKIFSISNDPPYSLFFWIAMIITSVIIFAMADYVPSRSNIGRAEASNWLAFKKFLADPNPVVYDEGNYDLFTRYLPYAIVLECEAAWAQRFSKHNFMLPEWFITDKQAASLEDFCLLLFPIVSYVGQNFESLKAPGI